LIEIKQVVPRASLKPVLSELTRLVSQSCLVYPKEVVKELEEGKNKHKPDAPYEWAKSNQNYAAPPESLFPDVAELLRKWPQLGAVLDSNKTDGPEEADLYVLALALRHKASRPHVLVVTEESKQRPDRMPLSVACGVVRIPSYTMKAFLQDRKIWPASYGGGSVKGPT
jgi:hypothetical protein